jgi:hypothetical protein
VVSALLKYQTLVGLQLIGWNRAQLLESRLNFLPQLLVIFIFLYRLVTVYLDVFKSSFLWIAWSWSHLF